MNYIFVIDFQKNASIFNVFLANQCSFLINGSVIPQIDYKTNKHIRDFFPSDLFNIFNNLNPNKAYGNDNISIKIIQICGDSIIPPLKSIFESAIKLGHFHECWRKGNIIPVQKK